MAASKQSTKKAASRASSPATAPRSRKPTKTKASAPRGKAFSLDQMPALPLRAVLLFVLFLTLTALLMQLYYT